MPQIFKFGKHPKRNDRKYRTLQFTDYVEPGLPTPPSASANLARVYKNLNVSDPAQLFPIDANDTVGDCTINTVAHLVTIFNGFLGRNKIPSVAEVLALYHLLTGGPDTGLDMLTVMNYIRQNPFLNERPILAFAEIDPLRTTHMQLATNWFGGVYTGFQVQSNAIQDFEANRPWTAGELTEDGHCVALADYFGAPNPQNITDLPGWVPLTWGKSTTATKGWEQKCVDECYAIIPVEAQEPGFCPGFDLPKLLANLTLVTH